MLLKDPCLRTTPGALVVLSLGLCACSPLDGSSWLGWRPGREGPAPHSGYEPPEPPDTPQFTQRIVVPELVTPWEITWGPDDQLWVTEREGPRVLRVDPETGAVAVAAEIPEVLAEVSQDGLLGLALHPRFLQGEGSDYVYVAYSYDADADPETVTKRTKLRRFTYNVETESLED
ncbi:MAG: PQQ-dependent sugar dehydrogenase, partial [Polyangiales bacterium]